MEIGSDQGDGNSQACKRAESAHRREINPKHGNDSAGNGHMAGRKGCIFRPAVKKIEPVDPVVNERGIVVNPCIWPGSAEDEFELGLGRFGNDEANAAKERAFLASR